MAAIEEEPESARPLRTAQESFVEQKDRSVTCTSWSPLVCLTHISQVYSADLLLQKHFYPIPGTSTRIPGQSAIQGSVSSPMRMGPPPSTAAYSIFPSSIVHRRRPTSSSTGVPLTRLPLNRFRLPRRMPATNLRWIPMAVLAGASPPCLNHV